ncbi:hypothetical protein J1N35_001434, partial [Gossypium stocksii]
KEIKEPEEETEKIESVSITTDCKEKEANSTPTPLVDNTSAIQPPFIKPMNKHDSEINRIIYKVTKYDDEQEHMPL